VLLAKVMEGKYDIIRDMGGFEPLLDNRTPIDRREAVPSEGLRPGAEKMDLRLEEHLRLPRVSCASLPPLPCPSPPPPPSLPIPPVHSIILFSRLLSQPRPLPHNYLFHRQGNLVQKLNFVIDAGAIA
jgi:hypothetical protein